MGMIGQKSRTNKSQKSPGATKRLRIVFAASVLALGYFPAKADQRDPELTAFFAELAATQNPEKASLIASEIWQRWSVHEDERTTTQLALGTKLMEQGLLSAAESVFSELVKNVPDFAEAWNKRATVNFQLGRFQQSKQDIAKTLALEPRHFGALAGLGMVELHLGNPEAALLAYDKAREIYPEMRDIDDVVKMLEEVVRGQPL